MLAGLTEFKAYMDILDIADQDTVLDIVLSSADAYMRTYCGREFESLRRSRTLDAVNYSTIWVPEFPLLTVHGMTAFTSNIDTVGIPCHMMYVMWYESGLIQSDEQIFCPSFPKSVVIDYTAGYAPNASDLRTLKWICLEIAAQMYRNRGIANIEQYNAGGVQWQKYSATADVTPMLGPEVLAILNSFRRVGPRDWV
jgi:hypothetical protein